MSTADTPIAPQGTPELASLIDEAGSIDRFGIQRQLNALQTTAASEENTGLVSAVRCEGNVYSIFRGEDTLLCFGENLGMYLYPTDLPYLRERAATTTNKRARARYLHSIATLTTRQDDGRAVIDAMIDALREARSVTDSALTAEAFWTLVDLYPLAFALGRRFRYIDPILDEAIAFLDGPDSPYIHAKTRVFRLIVQKVRLSDAYAQRLRPASLHLPAEAYGDSRGEVTSVAAAARSLADRLGDAHAPWLEAEAAGLEG